MGQTTNLNWFSRQISEPSTVWGKVIPSVTTVTTRRNTSKHGRNSGKRSVDWSTKAFGSSEWWGGFRGGGEHGNTWFCSPKVECQFRVGFYWWFLSRLEYLGQKVPRSWFWVFGDFWSQRLLGEMSVLGKHFQRLECGKHLTEHQTFWLAKPFVLFWRLDRWRST